MSPGFSCHRKSDLHNCEIVGVRQIIILAGVGRGGGMRMALLGVEAPNQALAQRVEVMQLEMAALMQRMELLNAELAAAARHLANQTADVA